LPVLRADRLGDGTHVVSQPGLLRPHGEALDEASMKRAELDAAGLTRKRRKRPEWSWLSQQKGAPSAGFIAPLDLPHEPSLNGIEITDD
jgi:hypothetical protein